MPTPYTSHEGVALEKHEEAAVKYLYISQMGCLPPVALEKHEEAAVKYLYISQKQLPREMKSRLVMTVRGAMFSGSCFCGGYILQCL